jgi:hypothetical protein
VTTPVPSPANFRYERKFIAHGVSLAEVLVMVRQLPALFREAYPARAINNLYLDSPTLRDYFDHVGGTANRIKTRIRWYGPLHGHIPRPTLEQKVKRGQVSGKVSRALPPLHVNGGLTRAALAAFLDAGGLPDRLRAGLRHLEPALVNRYQRRYYESADHRLRLTVDSQLEFLGPHGAGGTQWQSLVGRPHDVIIELKYAPEHADAAAAVANHLPFRMVRCSKYVLGIERLQQGR